MGNSGSSIPPPTPSDPSKATTNSVGSSEQQARADAKLSADPLYVLYGAPSCGFCVKAAGLLEKRQKHHCKIGTDFVPEAMAGSGAPFSGTIPQIFSCPSAELLLEAAGSEPGALGATAHGAVKSRMCTHIGGYSQLLEHMGPEPETIFKTITVG